MKKRIIRLLVLLMLAAGFAACARFEPVPYVNQAETMPGPGLFSGETGEFTLMKKE